jgi:hypothetical protein
MSSPALREILGIAAILKIMNKEAVGVGGKDLKQEIGHHD